MRLSDSLLFFQKKIVLFLAFWGILSLFISIHRGVIMGRYLDPKADIVFKKIFGQHPHLLISFLNAVLPLPEDSPIESLEYLSNEQVPVIEGFKYTIVDVKCRDSHGRTFIVEMQVQWTASFMQRLLYGTSTAYVHQIRRGEEYDRLKPVYGLGLVATTFDHETPEWYHHFKLGHVKNQNRSIDDLQLIFIELPKFQPTSIAHQRLQVLWLRFMKELDNETIRIPEEWLSVPEIKEAVALSEEAAYTPAELNTYLKYWDMVSTERTMVSDSLATGFKEGKAVGITEGIETTVKILHLLQENHSDEVIIEKTGATLELIHQLRNQFNLS